MRGTPQCPKCRKQMQYGKIGYVDGRWYDPPAFQCRHCFHVIHQQRQAARPAPGPDCPYGGKPAHEKYHSNCPHCGVRLWVFSGRFPHHKSNRAEDRC